MTAEQRILTPATRLRWDAQKLRKIELGLALEGYALLGPGPDYPHRAAYDRIVRAGDRLGQLAAEIEAIAEFLDPEPVSIDVARDEVDQAYTFGVRAGDDEPA